MSIGGFNWNPQPPHNFAFVVGPHSLFAMTESIPTEGAADGLKKRKYDRNTTSIFNITKKGERVTADLAEANQTSISQFGV